jgi:hypothetical protein
MRRLLGVVLLVGPAFAAPAFAGPLRFVDVTAESGIRFRNLCGAPAGEKGWLSETMGAGAAWLDYDGDGNLDLYLVNGSTYDREPGAGEANQLYRGDGKGGFVDVTAKAGVGHKGWGYGVAVGDWDNDGDPDMFVTNFGPNVLYRNDGDGSFTDVTARAGVAGEFVWSASSAFLDGDNDGDLDLYVDNYMASDPKVVPRRGSEAAIAADCNYRGIPVVCGPLRQVPLQDTYYRNNGDGTFTDVTKAAGMHLGKPRFALGVVAADYDNDGDMDVYVANDSLQNSLWRNDGGTFTDVGVQTLAALNADGRAQAGMGTNFGDYNRDGWSDIVVTNFAHDLNAVYKNLGGKFFIDDSTLTGMGVTNLALSWGVGFYDFDHDADLDMLIANGHIYPQVDGFDIGTRFLQRNHLFLNDGGRFKEVGSSAGPGLAIERSFRGAAFADYDEDGDVDVLLTTLGDEPLLLRNDTVTEGHWLEVRLVGGPSNRDAVGARVVVSAGGISQLRQRKGGGSYLSASDPRLHFGLGAAERVQRIEVFWPSGGTRTLSDLAADRVLTIRETAPASTSGN